MPKNTKAVVILLLLLAVWVPPLFMAQSEGGTLVQAPGESKPVDTSNVDVRVDANLNTSAGIDVQALRAEASGRGHLVVKDGGRLAGRVVAEGITIEDRARVYIEHGLKIVCVGDFIIGRDVQFLATPTESKPNEPTIEKDGEGAQPGRATLQDLLAPAPTSISCEPGQLPVSCANVTTRHGRSGRSPRGSEATVIGNTLINAWPLAPFNGAPGEAVMVAGNRSAVARGGAGGDGADLGIIGIGPGATLTIGVAISNALGGNGGNATATGAAGPVCECGGDARAVGGKGGSAGSLDIQYPIINFMAGGGIKVSPGGTGGNATATGGPGGDCNVCGRAGGRGGHAEAIAGRAGSGPSLYRITANSMSPAPAAVLAAAGIAPGSAGGASNATAGAGGIGGDNCPCGDNGGPGGPGGSALACGGNGGKGAFLISRGGGATSTKGGNGGNGGPAAATNGRGGNGALGGLCQCLPFPFPPPVAGNGGAGGASGAVSARGGNGGGARWGPAAIAVPPPPVTGNGGAAATNCNPGGNGGKGGDCIGHGRCMPGAGGPLGTGGHFEREGGRAGQALQGATPGAPGAPQPPVAGNCPNGAIGARGNPCN